MEKQLSSGKELLAVEVPQTLSHQIQVLMKLIQTRTRADDIKSPTNHGFEASETPANKVTEKQGISKAV